MFDSESAFCLNQNSGFFIITDFFFYILSMIEYEINTTKIKEYHNIFFVLFCFILLGGGVA